MSFINSSRYWVTSKVVCVSLFALIRLHTIKGRALRQQDSWSRFDVGALNLRKLLQCPHIIIPCSNFGACRHVIILDPTHSNVCRCHSYLLLAQCFVERFMQCVENAHNWKVKWDLPNFSIKIGRAHVWTPVTWNDLVCRLLLEKKKKHKKHTQKRQKIKK